MMYVNLIWAWGHPEVYILILPDFWDLFGGRPHICGKTAVWLCVDGMGFGDDRLSFVHRLGAPLLYYGSKSGDQLFLCHCDDVDRHSNRGQDLQLVVHEIPWACSL